MSSFPFVSVIVPAYNASASIGECVHALQQQTYPPTRYEVIVVDDGSQDATAELAQTAGARVFTPGRIGRSAARNLGARHASGEILLFTDSDCAPFPDWVAQMVAPFQQSASVVGVKGRYRTRQREIVARFTQVECEERYARMAQQANINFVDTYSAAYRASTFWQAGGFDEGIEIVEDQDLSFRIASAGHKMIFQPAAQVYHQHLTQVWRYARRKWQIAYRKPLIVRPFPSRLWSDSRTPQNLKLQMLLSAVLLAGTLALPLALALSKATLVLAIYLTLWGIFLTLCLPFLRETIRHDAALLPWAIPLLFVRALGLFGGLVAGTLVPYQPHTPGKN